MVIYILILLLIIYNSYKYDIKKCNDKGNKIFYLLMFILFLTAGLRYHIGIDTMRYERAFERIQPLSLTKGLIDWEELSQPLWFFINSFFRSLSDNFVFVQLLHSAVLHILLSRFIIKTSKKPFIALGVFYCVSWWNFSFEIMRESLCVGLYLNALLSLGKKDYKTYSLYALISMGIHWFAFVIFLITPLACLCRENLLRVVVVLSGISILLLDTSSISNSIYVLSAISESDASARVISYLESDTQGAISVTFLGIIFIVLTQALYPILISIQYSKVEGNELYSKILLLYVIFVLLRINILIFDRFCNYLIVVLIVSSINILADRKTFRMKNMCMYYLYFCIAYFVYRGINGFISPSNLEYRANIKYDCRYIPYKTVFQDADKTREDFYNYYIY